jgi:hypothetical protein
LKTRYLSITLIVSACLIAGTSAGLLESKNLASGALQAGHSSSPLPSSLDAYYPPEVPQPVYRFQMIALGNAFTGIISDFLSGDLKNAKTNLAAFKALYDETSRLVPEWRGLFPSEPLAQVEKAFQAAAGSNDPAPLIAGLDKVENACSSCHHAYMASVHFKYHWKDFEEVMAKDPMTGKNIGFARLMQILNLGFAGSWIDFGQGQQENSGNRFREFNATFQSLKGTCEECHGTSERQYFVDKGAQAMVEAYGKSLAGGSGNAKMAEAAMMAVGNDICFKCHLVHVPAAYSKGR